MSRRSTRLNPTQDSNPSKDSNQLQAKSTSTTSTFKLTQTSTSLTAIPSSTNTTLFLLVHSTNAFGTWGAGFAKALQSRYPSAELIYKSWCDDKRPSPDQWPSKELVGRCLVVDPQDEDQSTRKGASGNGVAIACLFTSYGYGSRAVKSGKGGGHAAKDGVKKVVESTKSALDELRAWIARIEEGTEEIDKEAKKRKVVVYSPKFNSGNFGVDWEDTEAMIQEVFADWDGEWRVLAGK